MKGRVGLMEGKVRRNHFQRVVLCFLFFTTITVAYAGPYPRSYILEKTKQAFRSIRIGGNFWKAVEENKTSKVRWMLRFHPELANEPVYYGKTPLLLARTLAMAELLCEAGADVNFPPPRFDRPIFGYIETGDSVMIRLLLKHGLDLSLTGRERGLTPLEEAIRLNSMELVEILVKGGAEINPKGNGPLYAAARYGSVDVIKYFLSQNIDFDRTEILVKTIEASKPDEDNFGKHVDVARLLLNNGADPKTVYSGGYHTKYTETLLTLAVDRGDVHVARLLIEKGAGIELVNSGKDTPLLVAIEKENRSIVRMLLDKGANVEHESGNGETPLFAAIGKGDIEIVEMLLAKGADVNHEIRDDWRRSPLCFAISWHRPQIAVLLINSGADINPTVKGKEGGPLNRAANRGYVDIVSLLLERGALIDAKGFRGSRTPLHEAAEEGHLDVFEVLVRAGADTTLRDSMNRTALDLLKPRQKKKMALVIREQKLWPVTRIRTNVTVQGQICRPGTPSGDR